MADYDLEIDRIVAEIKKIKAKTVCLQLPDGLKPRAGEIQDILKEKTDAKILIWGGSCFGSCDLPQNLNSLGVDLLVQFGHSEWE